MQVFSCRSCSGVLADRKCAQLIAQGVFSAEDVCASVSRQYQVSPTRLPGRGSTPQQHLLSGTKTDAVNNAFGSA